MQTNNTNIDAVTPETSNSTSEGVNDGKPAQRIDADHVEAFARASGPPYVRIVVPRA